MSRFRVLPGAAKDLDGALLWHEEQREGLGFELLEEYERRLALALEEPGVGSIVRVLATGEEIRRYRLQRFQRYAILMVIIDGMPTVVAFEHGRRKPGYWRARLD